LCHKTVNQQLDRQQDEEEEEESMFNILKKVENALESIDQTAATTIAQLNDGSQPTTTDSPLYSSVNSLLQRSSSTDLNNKAASNKSNNSSALDEDIFSFLNSPNSSATTSLDSTKDRVSRFTARKKAAINPGKGSPKLKNDSTSNAKGVSSTTKTKKVGEAIVAPSVDAEKRSKDELSPLGSGGATSQGNNQDSTTKGDAETESQPKLETAEDKAEDKAEDRFKVEDIVSSSPVSNTSDEPIVLKREEEVRNGNTEENRVEEAQSYNEQADDEDEREDIELLIEHNSKLEVENKLLRTEVKSLNDEVSTLSARVRGIQEALDEVYLPDLLSSYKLTYLF